MAYIHIAGRLGGDPETRFTAGGKKVTSFNVAENIRGANGEEQTVWYRIVIWGDRFDKMITHLKKGSAVYVVGEHRPSKWTDDQGQQRVTEEVWAFELRFGPLPPTKQERTEGGEQESRQPQPAAQRQPAFSPASSSSAGFAPAPSAMGMGQPAASQGHFDDPDEDLPF